MRGLRAALLFLGRFFISILFLVSGINKILDWQATERGFVSLLCDWHSYVSYSIFWQEFFSWLLPWVPAVLVILTLIELVGGLLVLFGIKPRFGAFLLILFFVPMTILLHQFWYLDGIRREMQLLMFMKNVAIFGGLIYILVFGTKLPKEEKPTFVSNPPLKDE